MLPALRIPTKIVATLVALALALALGGPKASDPQLLRNASLKKLDLSGTPASLPAALSPLAAGRRAGAASVNAAQTGNALSGAAGATGRIAVSLGDVNGGGSADILDVRAVNGTLSYQLISGEVGMTLWRAAPIVRPATVHAAVFTGTLNAGAGRDFYLLEQYEKDSSLTWTLHAFDGPTGQAIWSTSGSIPTGLPQAPNVPPSIPPSVPPVTVPTVPSVDPSALPVPSEVPSVDPSALPSVDPSALPSGVPSVDPSALPVPSEVPSVDPSALPSVDPSALPTPSGVPTIDPTGIPSVDPSAVPSIPPSIDPSILPSDLPPPPGGTDSRHRAANSSSASTFAAYVTGATPKDVNGDGLEDFALTQHVGFAMPDGSSVVVAQLTTLGATDGRMIGTIVAAGRNAMPVAGVGGDFFGQGRPGLFASDVVSTQNGIVATYRTFTYQGIPLWVAAESIPAETIGTIDGSSDLTGDGLADLMITRMPILTGSQPTVISVRTSPLGQEGWRRSLPESSVARVAGALDESAGADVVTQGLKINEAGQIPSAVVYRSMSGATGTDIRVNDVRVGNGGTLGDWYASLSTDAGNLDADSTPDLMHAVNAVPSNGLTTLWSQAAVSARATQTLWSREGPMNPGEPAGGNIAGDGAADVVSVTESATRQSDALVIRAASGRDGAAAWTSRVVVGGGTERVRQLTAKAADLTGSSNLIITVIQRSGASGTRSLIVSVRGSTGQVLWIRTT